MAGLVLGLWVGCAENTGVPADAGAQRDAGRDAGPGGFDAGPPPMPDAGPPPPTAVSFVAMGDTGEGNAAQSEVAAQIVSTCAAEGCDFVMLLGDNFYDSGVDSVDDSQWQTKFETPYAAIDLPFYAVLGNHDYGGSLLGLDYGGLGNEFDRGPIEVAYSARSMKWTMPDTHYTFRIGEVGFVMLDTNSILWDDTSNGDQRAWFAGAVAELRADGARWIFAAGHHPYLSNGRHGNAGSYESIEGVGTLPFEIPYLSGGEVQSFMDEVMCGQVDAYFCGHDHNRQWINEPSALCGAELIVTGAGAKTTDFSTTDNQLYWGDDTTEGFMYVRIEGDQMYGRMVNRDGSTAFEQTVTLEP